MQAMNFFKRLALANCLVFGSVSVCAGAENPNVDITPSTPKKLSQKMEFDQQHFVSLTFHDVRDDVLKEGDRDPYAMSTQNLVQFFEWLKHSDWHPVSLKQIQQARQQGTALPKNAVLLSFDDGALSSYSHVFPLIKEYQIPVVFALVTSWMNGNTKAIYEAYGQGNQMSWDQVRDMQASGWVEFASHSHDLHQGILANPQKNQEPAAITRQYLQSKQRYETDLEYQHRILQDLTTSRNIIEKETGVRPIAIIWPYGAVNVQVEKIAMQAGLPLSFSLGKDAVNSVQDGTYQRGLAVNNPTVEDLYEQMTDSIAYGGLSLYEPIRALSFNLHEFSADAIHADQQLGDVLNLTSALKNNMLILNVVEDQNGDGIYDRAYFPTQHLTLGQDVTNRMTWQSKTRIFNRVYANLPLKLQQQKADLVVNLTDDLLKNNSSLDGIFLQTDQQLQCVFTTKNDTDCQQQQQNVVNTLMQMKQKSNQYTNLSNQFRVALQVKLNTLQQGGIQHFLTQFNPYASLFSFDLDPLQQPEVFQQFIKQIDHVLPQQKAQIMVNLHTQSAKNDEDWKKLQHYFLTLQRVGIQKLAIDRYAFDNAEDVQAFLYTPFSLNQSPLTYRNPFISKTQGKSP